MVLYTLGGNEPKKKTIQTRLGYEIPCEELPLDMNVDTVDHVDIRANVLKSDTPGIQIRSVSAHFYNCVGMVFAARRRWIDIEHLEKILTDDGYRLIGAEEVMIGDVVIYRDRKGDLSHVGIIVAKIGNIGQQFDFMVLSKWGRDAEFLHRQWQVSADLGQPSEYYTERILPSGKYDELR